MKKIIWLGQGGWLLHFDRTTLMLDPYLSDSVAKVNPQSKRKTPISKEYLHFHPDYLCITHSHLDHLDPETYPFVLDTDRPVTVFAPYDSWCQIRKQGGTHNYVLLDRHSAWTAQEFEIHAVKAAHSDLTAVGYVILHAGKSYYFAGDTVYNREVVSDVRALCPDGVDYAFLPINGVGNNTNPQDAARLAREVGAGCAVPAHFGTFDTLDPTCFSYARTVIPTLYQALPL